MGTPFHGMHFGTEIGALKYLDDGSSEFGLLARGGGGRRRLSYNALSRRSDLFIDYLRQVDTLNTA